MSNERNTIWARHGRRLLSLDEAWAIIAENVRPIGAEQVSLSAAGGRVLASPLRADEDNPGFDRAMMDGFAVRAADVSSAGTILRIIGAAAAGDTSVPRLSEGEAVRINTGAPVPDGGDAVVRVEDTTTSSDSPSVTVRVAARPGLNVVRRGSIRRRGEIVLDAPVVMGPAQICVAATVGAAKIDVAREVGAAIVSTGNEIVEPGSPRQSGQIYESNSPMLAALARQFGASPYPQGIVRDDPEDLRTRLEAALRQPVVMTIGGMSMGTLDLVPGAIEALGGRWLFHGVDMRPGKPVAYARGPAGQHIVGLPGNPVSSFVCAWLFTRMIIRGLQGFAVEPPPRLRATLASALNRASDTRPAFVPARVWSDAQRGLLAEPIAWGGSGDPFGLAQGNALLVRTDPTLASAAGDGVEVIMT